MMETGECKRCGSEAWKPVLEQTGGYCETCEFMTPSEAAGRLSINWRTIYRYFKKHLIPVYRTGPKALKVRRADVERLIVAIK